MSSFKKLSKSDITTVLYTANKQWSLQYSGVPNDDIVLYKGRKEPFNITGSTYNGQYKSLIYSTVNHSYYQSYFGELLNTSSLMLNADTYESASQQRATASYFDYNINPLFVNNFPTSSNSTIEVLSISKNKFGSKVLPYSFNISSSTSVIQDDGNGNLYDISQFNDDYTDIGYVDQNYFNDLTPNVNIIHVGNIFYAQGMVILTTPTSSYGDIFTGSYSISFRNEHRIYENEVRCVVNESNFNLSYNPSLLKYGGQYITSGSGGYTITGSFDSSVKDFATGSDFQPYVTTIGLYNDNNELLMTAKLGKPIIVPSDTDISFVVSFDT